MRNPCYENDGTLGSQKDYCCDMVKWNRWDEELVAEFVLWINLFKKTFVVVVAVSLVCFIVV